MKANIFAMFFACLFVFSGCGRGDDSQRHGDDEGNDDDFSDGGGMTGDDDDDDDAQSDDDGGYIFVGKDDDDSGGYNDEDNDDGVDDDEQIPGCDYTSPDGKISGHCDSAGENKWQCKCEGNGSADMTAETPLCEDAMQWTCNMVSGGKTYENYCGKVEDCPGESLVLCGGEWACVQEECEYHCLENSCIYYVNGEVSCPTEECAVEECSSDTGGVTDVECPGGSSAAPVCKRSLDGLCVWFAGDCPCQDPGADCPQGSLPHCPNGRWICSNDRCAYSCNRDSCLHYENGEKVCATPEGQFCECYGSGAICRENNDCPEGTVCNRKFGSNEAGKCISG
ncbi:MAG: hypothetical protein Kow0090_08990 [Myxococcota bacterium]